MIEQALFAIDDMQTIGLFHRDIKTKNFVVASFEEYANNSSKKDK